MGKNLGLQTHIIKGNFVWSLPTMNKADSAAMKIVAAVANDWQLSGVVTAGSAARYTPSFSYNSNGASVNLTGSPSYPARIVLTGLDTGSGCADNRYAQFNVAAFSGPRSEAWAWESVSTTWADVRTTRSTWRFSGCSGLAAPPPHGIRLDVFNAFNAVIYNGRQPASAQ
jgi:hypothetical protein